MKLKMTGRGIITIIIVFSILIFGIGACSKNISVKRNLTNLEAEFVAETKSIEATYETMYKKIKESAKITREFTQQEKDFYLQYIQNKVEKKDKVLFEMLRESNPTLTSDMYKNLLFILDKERERLLSAQKKAIDLERQYNAIKEDPIDSYFFKEKKNLEKGYTVISSTKTKNVMDSRVDDEELF